MRKLYADDRYFTEATRSDTGGYTDYAAQEAPLRATFRRLLRVLHQRGRLGGELLEVGCGFGYLLDEAQPYFTRRTGTDYSARALQVARGHADALYCGGVDAVPQGQTFDCVMSVHVIEHVHRPQLFLAQLLERLRPGGLLLIATPDAGSLWRSLMGRRWPSYKLPEHLLYLDRHTLPRLLLQCGVVNLEPVPYPHAFPLPLVAAKLGLRWPLRWAGASLWLPGTTLAISGSRSHDSN